VLLFWDGESSVIYVEASGVPRGNSLKVEDAHRLDFYICEANARNFGQIALFSRLNVEISGVFAKQEAVYLDVGAYRHTRSRAW
jgi:hypothetical protein